MSARHGQGFTTWLIMLPLLVVPLIAVFGVPQFAPITARTADGASGEEPVLELGLSSDAPLAESVPPFPGGALEHAPTRLEKTLELRMQREVFGDATQRGADFLQRLRRHSGLAPSCVVARDALEARPRPL